MDWGKLKAFYHVARLSSMSKASLVVNLTQSAVSRQIISLEKRIGRPLFIRTKKGLILTEEGEFLYESAGKMLEEAEKAQSQILGLSKDVLGEIKIATTNALASSWLPLYVPEFLKLYPKVRMTIIGNEGNLDLRSREADVAIRTYTANQPNLVQDYLTAFHIGLYASEDYLNQFGHPKDEEDLDNHRLLSFGRYEVYPYGNINWILEVGSKSYARKPYLSVNSSQGLHLMTENGVGIAALSKEYTKHSTKLVRVLPHVKGPIVKVYYVYPHEFSNIKRIKFFGEFLKAKMRG